ncbi:mRNA turnover protein 4-like protein [Formica fusca]
MPKSKRDKKVSLTKTNKKGLILKQRIIEDIKKIIELGLGKAQETEIADGIHKLANAIRNHSMKGQCGLLFTNRSKKQVVEWAQEYEEMEYARSGFVTPETVELPEGPLSQFQHSMEPQLRQLGMPTSLQKGVITLIKPFRVCQKDDILTPEQAQILKLLDKPLAVFKLLLLGVYTKKYGFKKLKVPDNTTENDEEEMDVDNDNT